MYQSRNLGQQVEKETSVSKEATFLISYQELVSRRRPGAHSNIYNSIKYKILQQNNLLEKVFITSIQQNLNLQLILVNSLCPLFLHANASTQNLW